MLTTLKWMRLGLLAGALAMGLNGCATSFRPKDEQLVNGLGAFTFQLSPEQCEQLKRERRNYNATREVSTWAAGAGLVCTGIMLGFTDSKEATAVCTGVGAVAEGTSLFTSSQVKSLDAELAAGGCPR